MSLSSGLNAGVAGLSVNSTRLAVISDNIANSNTTGYRRSDVDFTSLVTGTEDGAFTAGGVRVTTFRDVSTPGALITSGNSTDIAVSGGSGLLPVTPRSAVDQAAGQRPFQMIATGAFRQDEAGFLVTPGGLALQGWPVDADGTLLATVSRDSPTSLEPVRLSAFLTAASSTTEIELGVNLPADETLATASGDPIETTIEYFTAIGQKNQLTVNFTPTIPATGSSNEWTVQLVDSATTVDAGVVGEFTVVFDPSRTGAGAVLSVTPTAANAALTNPATFDAATGAATITVPDGDISVQLQSTTNGTGMSQLAADFTPNGLTKNGAPAGNLDSLEIDEQGFLSGVYDTGQRRKIFQIPLATVPNPNGLTALDNQAFEISRDSGDVFFFDAGPGPAGEIRGFALQQSTVDIAKELTNLIVTQRAFSSNATVIQTVDEMLQETTNLKR